MMKRVFLFLFVLTSFCFSQTTQWRLLWDPNPEADMSHYEIYRDFTPSASVLLDTVMHPTSLYVDSTIQAGIIYYYRLKAVNTSGQKSDFSAEVYEAIPDIVEIPNQFVRAPQVFPELDLSQYFLIPDNETYTLEISGNVSFGYTLNGDILTVAYPQGFEGTEVLSVKIIDNTGFNDIETISYTVSGEMVSPSNIKFEFID